MVTACPGPVSPLSAQQHAAVWRVCVMSVAPEASKGKAASAQAPLCSRLSAAAVHFLPTVQIRAEDKISSEKTLLRFPVPK